MDLSKISFQPKFCKLLFIDTKKKKSASIILSYPGFIIEIVNSYLFRISFLPLPNVQCSIGNLDLRKGY